MTICKYCGKEMDGWCQHCFDEDTRLPSEAEYEIYKEGLEESDERRNGSSD